MVIPTMCHGCSYGGYNCGLLAHVQDGVLQRVEGNPHHPLNKGKLCAKGQSAVQWVYNKQRLRYPLQREGPRGTGPFKRISWDAALDLAAEKIAGVKDRVGPEGILFGKGQSSGWAGLHQFLWVRFMNCLGSPNLTNWGPSVCYAPQLLYHKTILGARTYARPDYDHADLIIEWSTGGGTGGAARGGAETLDTNLRSVPVKIVDRLEKGAKLVVINPQQIPLAANGRVTRWVPVRPGTDGALALAMIHVILREDLYDHDFVHQWCEGLDRLAAHVKNYPPEWAETITGIKAEEIRTLAREYANTRRACIRFAEAPQKQNLQCFAMALPILMAITGHLDREGGNIWFFPCAQLRFSTLYERVPKEVRESVLGGEQYSIRSQGYKGAGFHSVIQALITGEPYRPGAMLIFGSNPMNTARNPSLIAKALAKLDFLMVTDLAFTPTARYADLVLPAATRYECEGQPSLWHNHLTMSHQVIEPLWESRDELKTTLDLACKLGMADDFWRGDYTAMVNEFLSPVGVTIETLKESALKGIYLPETDWMNTRQRFQTLFKDLPNGKIQLWSSQLDSEGFDPVPCYRGEAEDPLAVGDLERDDALWFTDEHSAYINHHAWMRDIPWLRELEKFPVVKIHPETAARHGLRDGDWVELTSSSGRMKAMARLFDGIRPDTLMAQHGWWQPCEALSIPEYSPLDGGTNPNTLYNWEYRDPITGDITKNAIVRIRRSTEPENQPLPKEVP